MQCPNCGTNMPDGSSFCTTCGTPLGDDTKTVLLDPNLAASSAPTGMPNPAPQPAFNQPMGQTGYGQPMNQQPMGQTGYAQPMNQQPMGQTGYAQPMGQPMNQMGAPMGQTGYAQPMGQPYGQPMAPKAPRKPMSEKTKKSIIFGLIGVAALALIIFVVVLLTRPKLKGSYKAKDYWGDTYTYVFNDGTFVKYNEDDEVECAGTYTQKKDKVTLISIEDEKETARFDNKDNKVKIDGTWYKSKDKKATNDFTVSKTFLADLQKDVEQACSDALKDEDVYESLEWSYWTYIDGDDLKDPYSDFEEFLAKALDYKNDAVLSRFLEDDFIAIEIEWDDISKGKYEVTIDVYGYY